MDLVQRTIVVIWMYAALFTGALIAVLPVLVVIGLPWVWSNQKPDWAWVGAFTPWAARIGALLALWIAARRAATRFPQLLPTALVVSGVVGAAIGVPLGRFLAASWLPHPTLFSETSDMAGDLVALTVLCCFGIAVWCGSFWRSRKGMTALGGAAEQADAADEAHGGW